MNKKKKADKEHRLSNWFYNIGTFLIGLTALVELIFKIVIYLLSK